MLKRWSDFAAGCILLVSSIWMFIATLSIRTSDIAEISSALMPQIVCWIMGILSVALIVQGYKKAQQPVEKPKVENGEKNDMRTLALSALLLVAYGACFEPLGFVLSSISYLFIQGYLMTEPGKFRPVPHCIFAVAAPVLIDYIFRNWLSLVLPSGLLG